MAGQHILINGLSLNAGGAFIVARDLWLTMAEVQPDWTFSFALVNGVELSSAIDENDLPENCRVHWAPAKALNRLVRYRYENNDLKRWAQDQHVDAVLQVNGMVVANLDLPTVTHFQNPGPFLPMTWDNLSARGANWLKRRAHARALRRADIVTWVSAYLRDLTCDWLKIRPQRSEVLYNGIPDAWLKRDRKILPSLDARPLEIGTISTVATFKRQHLVIRALANLVKMPGLEDLRYRIIGPCRPESYQQDLESLARQLGIGDRVIFDGLIPHDRIPVVLQGLRCHVLMSILESFGLPSIEAMSFGTPVVTSNCCSMPEICGDAALLVDIDDVTMLTDAIARVLLEPECAADLQQRGFANLKRFDWRRTSEQMIGCLTDAMATRD